MTASYLYVPVVVLVLWLGHAAWSWRHPARRDPFALLLLAGLPLATALVLVAFALVRDAPRSRYDALPPGEQGDLRLRLLVLGVELVLAGVVTLALEAVLAPVRSSRRRRLEAGQPGSTPRGA